MVNGLMWLLVFQMVGEVISRVLDLPVPGPVIGMLLLFVALMVRRPAESAGVIRVSEGMLRHLQLLFIPPAVGVVTYLSVLRSDAVPIVGGLTLSWLAGLVTVGLLVTAMTRSQRHG